MEGNIIQRMSAATASINAVAKNLTVGYGQTRYKAVGEADVLAAVKPAEEKCGIYSYPVSRELIDQDIIETGGQQNTRRQVFMRIKTVYRFMNIDDPKDYIEITSYGDGVDTMDKAPGKAMTYSDKYALLKAYKIITGDDPDQYASEPIVSRTKIGAKKAAYLRRELELAGYSEHSVLAHFGKSRLEDLTESAYKAIEASLKPRTTRTNGQTIEG